MKNRTPTARVILLSTFAICFSYLVSFLYSTYYSQIKIHEDLAKDNTISLSKYRKCLPEEAKGKLGYIERIIPANDEKYIFHQIDGSTYTYRCSDNGSAELLGYKSGSVNIISFYGVFVIFLVFTIMHIVRTKRFIILSINLRHYSNMEKELIVYGALMLIGNMITFSTG